MCTKDLFKYLFKSQAARDLLIEGINRATGGNLRLESSHHAKCERRWQRFLKVMGGLEERLYSSGAAFVDGWKRIGCI